MVELLTGLAFALLYWNYGLSAELGMSIVYASFLIVIFFIDLDHQLILNKVSYPGIVVAFIFSFLWPDLGVVNALTGGAIGFAILFLPFIIYPKGMGGGDLKLALMIGLMVGSPEVLVGILMGIIGGGLAAILLLGLRIKRRGEAIPFGPFLCIGAMAALLWGRDIADWYLDLFR